MFENRVGVSDIRMRFHQLQVSLSHSSLTEGRTFPFRIPGYTIRLKKVARLTELET